MVSEHQIRFVLETYVIMMMENKKKTRGRAGDYLYFKALPGASMKKFGPSHLLVLAASDVAILNWDLDRVHELLHEADHSRASFPGFLCACPGKSEKNKRGVHWSLSTAPTPSPSYHPVA